ncbi:hypothetical protein AVEN_76432-1 [Araneus ventricosus]|uniref:Uncharacterized protein n=1 Tax=Araneus ventricosus TaxID=182803 RepID=A0A4Y2WDS5_ARAVE|nr:hypothetical protein AVEN_76432-1 [Araneus ventricosus]
MTCIHHHKHPTVASLMNNPPADSELITIKKKVTGSSLLMIKKILEEAASSSLCPLRAHLLRLTHVLAVHGDSVRGKMGILGFLYVPFGPRCPCKSGGRSEPALSIGWWYVPLGTGSYCCRVRACSICRSISRYHSPRCFAKCQKFDIPWMSVVGKKLAAATQKSDTIVNLHIYSKCSNCKAEHPSYYRKCPRSSWTTNYLTCWLCVWRPTRRVVHFVPGINRLASQSPGWSAQGDQARAGSLGLALWWSLSLGDS